MAKRFTDSEKWKDVWFSELTNDEKIVWLFLLDDCNHSGIWQVNLRRLNFECRTNYTLSDLQKFLGNRVCELSEEKWFIPKFISFQYPSFPNGSPAIKSVVKILDKEGLIQHHKDGSVTLLKELPLSFNTLNKGLDKGLDTQQDMDMDKDMDMELDMDTVLDKDLDKDKELDMELVKDKSQEEDLWSWSNK